MARSAVGLKGTDGSKISVSTSRIPLLNGSSYLLISFIFSFPIGRIGS